MKKRVGKLNPDAVIRLAKEDVFLMPHNVFGVAEFITELKNSVNYHWFCNQRERTRRWTEEGVQCEILAPNQAWQKGKIRVLILEFYPDDPEPDEATSSDKSETDEFESPLDDIRQMM